MTASLPPISPPPSILDTDLYKLTMQQAVFREFPSAQATYRFTLRDKSVLFTRQCFELFLEAVANFSMVSLTTPERDWLQKTCPYFQADYLEYLASYRFKPQQVDATFIPVSDDGQHGHIDIVMSGPWIETILWEVPLMACLSEIYFASVVTDWNYEKQFEQASVKARKLLEAGCNFMEFGTRRRRSFKTQSIVLSSLANAANTTTGPGKLLGTSNVHLARIHGIKPVGTVAHEWFMAIGAMQDYESATTIALDMWEKVYHDSLLVALTDTFSSDIFYRSFIENPEYARRWHGLRQDSGDPFEYSRRAAAIYESLGIPTQDKMIIHSDGLNVETSIRLKEHSEGLGFKTSFGIGTSFTNDFRHVSTGEKSKSLNMVIKLASIDGKPCVKISDELTKNTGDPAAIAKVKQYFGLPQL